MTSNAFETVTANGQKIKSYTRGDFSFVSVAPSKSGQDAIRRLWALQTLERNNIKGVDISKTGFPGTALFLKSSEWPQPPPSATLGTNYLSIQRIKES